MGKPVRNNKTDALKYVPRVFLTSKRNDHLLKDHFKEYFIETVDHSEGKRKDALVGCENIMVIIVVDRPPQKKQQLIQR